MPILVEIRTQNQDFFTIYSGESLNVDKENGLMGECDYILAKETHSFVIAAPIISVVEAKRNDLELGVTQCAAQMVGVQKFNEQNNKNIDTIYGCVTTANDWQFLKLEGKELSIDTTYYYLNDLEKILGAFQIIIDYYKSNI